jgi:hypothetical protein
LNVLDFGLIEGVVKRTRDNLIRVSIVVVTIVAWLSISNHCAVGALVTAKTQSPTAQMLCHGNQPSPSKKNGDEEIPCCKVLHATVVKYPTVMSDLTKFGQPTDYPKVVDSVWSSWLPHAGIANELDTGPPFVRSFAELILHRSLFSHAPPFLS